MLRLMTAAILAIGVMFCSSAADAQPRPPGDCSHVRDLDRCLEEEHRRALELFGIVPIEEHARTGARVRRAFYIDSYGRYLVAISFIRAPGRDPMLHVDFPTREGAARALPATAPVSEATWRQVLERSRHFDRDLVARPAAQNPDEVGNRHLDPDEVVVRGCLHGWVFKVEATDPSGPAAERMGFSQKLEDACTGGLTVDYAEALAELALPLLPYCSALDPEQHRNVQSLLAECGLLEGDRLAAAQAYNLVWRLRYVDGRDAGLLDRIFHTEAVLHWAGEELGGGTRSAVDAWVQRANALGRTEFSVTRVRGYGADRARIEGQLVRYHHGPGNAPSRRSVAPVALELEPDASDELRVRRATVGPFVEAPD
ncbi:MAG TPA: hypothetical protein VGB54_10110 [Allosphingosinicella sp.]|jgi:hypothetical protein